MLAAITGSKDPRRSQDAAPMQKDKARSFLEGLLNETLSMTVSDGRTFVGVFMCTDRDAAVLLADAWEYRGDVKRYVGLVVVPGKHTVKIEAETGKYI